MTAGDSLHGVVPPSPVASSGGKTVDVTQILPFALSIPPSSGTFLLKPRCKVSAVGRVRVAEPQSRVAPGQAPHCSVAHSCLFQCPYCAPGIMDLENVANRNGDPSTEQWAQPGSAGVGGAQGAGDGFAEVRVSGLVTMRIRAEEKHPGTQTCAHLTRVGDRASAAEAQTGGWEGGRRPWSLGSRGPLQSALSGFQV